MHTDEPAVGVGLGVAVGVGVGVGVAVGVTVGLGVGVGVGVEVSPPAVVYGTTVRGAEHLPPQFEGSENEYSRPPKMYAP